MNKKGKDVPTSNNLWLREEGSPSLCAGKGHDLNFAAYFKNMINIHVGLMYNIGKFAKGKQSFDFI